MIRPARLMIVFLIMGGLAACVSGKPSKDSYTDLNGKTVLIENDAEQCSRACNADYARCMDSHAAQNSTVTGAPTSMFGASAGCRSALSGCMLDCKSR